MQDAVEEEARVVHEDVRRAEVRRRHLHQVLGEALFDHAARRGDRVTASVAHGGGGGLRLRAIEVVHHDTRSLAPERARRRQPDAAPRARDDGHTPREHF